MQHAATHCNTLQRTATATHCNTLQHTATHWNTLQHTATHCNTLQYMQRGNAQTLQNIAIHWKDSLQHTIINCNTTKPKQNKTCKRKFWDILASALDMKSQQTLQHTATYCNTPQHTATHCSTLQHTAAHCITLQHTATHYSTLQHTATHHNTCSTANLWYHREWRRHNISAQTWLISSDIFWWRETTPSLTLIIHMNDSWHT